MSNIDKHSELRKELSNPAIGSNSHLRKLALALLDELEAEQRISATWRKTAESNSDNSPVIPDGWVMVPVEPTHEMQSAAACAIRFDTTPINNLS